MRGPLLYLTAVKLKNRIIDFLKKPARLIYVLVIGAFFALSVFSSGDTPVGELRSMSELSAILTLFYTLMLLLLVMGGNSGNNNMFSLSDASLLFPAPLSPIRVLFYGVVRQLGISLLLGVFLVFQYAMLSDVFGLTIGGLLLIIAGYALTLFFAQLINMAIYCRTSSSDTAEKNIKRAVAAIAILYLLAAFLSCREAFLSVASLGGFGAVISAGTDFFSGPVGYLFPISGWISACVGAVLTGRPIFALFLLLIFAAAAALLLLIIKSKNNYYEDALEKAETAFSNISAQKEGKVAEIAPKKVKLGKTGIEKGWGASVIYEKHAIENRRSGVFFLSGMSLLFAAIIIGMALFLRVMDLEDFDSSAGIIAAFAIGTYTQLFSTAMGRFSRELTKPYLYLIPEPPLKKLLYAIKESMISEALEAVVIFVPVALIVRASPLDAIFCILARISFSLLFTAGNIAVERVFGTLTSRALTFLFYFLVLILIAAPGLILGIVLLSLDILPGMMGLFLGVIVGNIPTAVLVMFLCRNMLQYAELNNN